MVLGSFFGPLVFFLLGPLDSVYGPSTFFKAQLVVRRWDIFCPGREFKLYAKSVLPVTKKEGKGRGNGPFALG